LEDYMKEGDVVQIAHVVKDMDAAMKHYHETLPVSEWSVYTLEPPLLRESIVYGKPSDHTYKIALAWANNVQFELIQPLTGRSIYDEFLETHGEGLHHVKFYYPDCQKALKEYEAKGYKVIQSGKIDEDEFYYLDTDKTMGVVVEVGNNGKIRDPEVVYPS
jgi:4-hydroxyphenylpyruvate dioxygenase-like putative hemolysin